MQFILIESFCNRNLKKIIHFNNTHTNHSLIYSIKINVIICKNSASVSLKILKKTDALIIIFYCKLLSNKQKWLVHFKNKNGAGKRT